MDKYNFQNEQVVTESHMAQILTDIELADRNQNRYGHGAGFLSGFGRITSPTSRTFTIDGRTFGLTANGNMIRGDLAELIVDITKAGLCPIGLGSEADGVEIAPGVGQWAFVTVLMTFIRKDEDAQINVAGAAFYFRNMESFQIRLVPGVNKTYADAYDWPVYPDVSSYLLGDTLVLGSAVVQNAAGTILVTGWQDMNRNNFVHVDPPLDQVGHPGLLQNYRITTLADGNWWVRDPYEAESPTPPDRFWHESQQGALYWTKKGKFHCFQSAHYPDAYPEGDDKLEECLLMTQVIHNTTNADIPVELRYRWTDHIRIMHHWSPFDGSDTVQNISAADSMPAVNDAIEVSEGGTLFLATFKPGANLLRAQAVNLTQPRNLLVQMAQFLNTTTLVTYSRSYRSLLGDAGTFLETEVFPPDSGL